MSSQRLGSVPAKLSPDIRCGWVARIFCRWSSFSCGRSRIGTNSPSLRRKISSLIACPLAGSFLGHPIDRERPKVEYLKRCQQLGGLARTGYEDVSLSPKLALCRPSSLVTDAVPTRDSHAATSRHFASSAGQLRLTPGGCRGTRRQACRARQAVLSRWVLLWWRAPLRLGGGHPRLEVLDQRRAKRLLGTFVDAESFSEVALDGAEFLAHLGERSLKVLRRHSDHREQRVRVAAEGPEVVEDRLLGRQELLVRQQVLSHHKVVRDAEQQQQGRRRPARAVLAGRAVEQRRPVLVLSELHEQTVVRGAGAGQAHDLAVAVLEERLPFAAAEHLLGRLRVRAHVEKLRGRRHRRILDHIEDDVLGAGRQAIGLGGALALRAQVVDRADAELSL